MKKIAFVTPWYGDKIPGGAETETRNIIKNLLKKNIEIEILTTCVEKFSSDWNKNYYKEGDYIEDNVRIKRFRIRKRNSVKFDNINALLMQRCKITKEQELLFFEEMVRSEALEEYIEKNINNYSLFCFIPYMFGTTYWGIKKAKKKSVIIPCLHDEAYAYMDLLKEIFNLVSGCVFLSKPEKNLAERLFFLKDTKKEVIGGGLNTKISQNFDGFMEKYKLKNPYILYAGRKDKGKNINLLIYNFKKFKERNPKINLDLVLIGGGEVKIPKEIKSSTHDLGFIDTEDKYKCYANSVVLVQPSVNESFSIVIMEAWLTGRPVLVNSRCEVTKNFAIESNGGLYFDNYYEFEEILKFYIDNEDVSKKMGENGRNYVLENFDSEIVTQKYIKFFEELVGDKN